jgi:hypothetical protein
VVPSGFVTQDRPATSGRQGDHSGQEKESDLATRLVPAPTTNGSLVLSAESRSLQTYYGRCYSFHPSTLKTYVAMSTKKMSTQKPVLKGVRYEVF